MHTNLSKEGDKWTVTAVADPDDKPEVRTFGSQKEAEDWRRQVYRDRELTPEATGKKVAAKKKAAKKS